MPDPRLITLTDLLTAGFDREELDDLATRLSIALDDLGGRTKAAQVRELTRYLDRRKRLDDLIRIGREQRPELDWP